MHKFSVHIEKPVETITIYDDRAFCNGGDAEKHPGVYLDLSATGRAFCPYCLQKFENVRRLGQIKSSGV